VAYATAVACSPGSNVTLAGARAPPPVAGAWNSGSTRTVPLEPVGHSLSRTLEEPRSF